MARGPSHSAQGSCEQGKGGTHSKGGGERAGSQAARVRRPRGKRAGRKNSEKKRGRGGGGVSSTGEGEGEREGQGLKTGAGQGGRRRQPNCEGPGKGRGHEGSRDPQAGMHDHP